MRRKVEVVMMMGLVTAVAAVGSHSDNIHDVNGGGCDNGGDAEESDGDDADRPLVPIG